MRYIPLILAASILIAAQPGGAEETAPAAPASPPDAVAAQSAASTPAPLAPESYGEASRRVALPYRFMRRGVEIRFDSIEVVDGSVRVNVTLKETRKAQGELRLSTVVSVETPNGQKLRYAGYLRGNSELQSNQDLPIGPEEEIALTLSYLPPPDTVLRAPVLVFPTGKWWSFALPKN